MNNTHEMIAQCKKQNHCFKRHLIRGSLALFLFSFGFSSADAKLNINDPKYCQYMNSNEKRDDIYYLYSMYCHRKNNNYVRVKQAIDKAIQLESYIGYAELLKYLKTNQYQIKPGATIENSSYTMKQLDELNDALKFTMEDFLLSPKSNHYRDDLRYEREGMFIHKTYANILHYLKLKYFKTVSNNEDSITLSNIGTLEEIFHYADMCMNLKKLESWTDQEYEVLLTYCSIIDKGMKELFNLEEGRLVSIRKCKPDYDKHGFDVPCIKDYIKNYGDKIGEINQSYFFSPEYKRVINIIF